MESNNKVAMLGCGEVGKTTIFKQAQLLFGPDKQYFLSEENRRFYILSIRSIVIRTIITLINQTQKLNCPLITDESKAIAKRILEISETKIIMKEWDKGYPGGEEGLVRDIRKIARDDGIKNVLKRYSEFNLIDSADYFLKSTRRIFQPDYVPTEDDFTHCYVMTVGISSTNLNVQGVPLKLFDSGGQRNERRKWKDIYRESPHVILYVASLAEYNLKLMEDPRVNRLQESLQTFEEQLQQLMLPLSSPRNRNSSNSPATPTSSHAITTNNFGTINPTSGSSTSAVPRTNPGVLGAKFILVLNKSDLFRQKIEIEKVPLSCCFPELLKQQQQPVRISVSEPTTPRTNPAPNNSASTLSALTAATAVASAAATAASIDQYLQPSNNDANLSIHSIDGSEHNSETSFYSGSEHNSNTSNKGASPVLSDTTKYPAANSAPVNLNVETYDGALNYVMDKFAQRFENVTQLPRSELQIVVLSALDKPSVSQLLSLCASVFNPKVQCDLRGNSILHSRQKNQSMDFDDRDDSVSHTSSSRRDSGSSEQPGFLRRLFGSFGRRKKTQTVTTAKTEFKNAASQYRIVKRLGQGGQGSIFLVENLSQNNEIQILKRVILENINELNHSFKEVQSLYILQHENVACIKDFFIEEKSESASNDGDQQRYVLCIVMEWCEGGDLFEFTKRHIRENGAATLLEEHVILAWLKQLVTALEYVHSTGFVHRDLKPHNIFLSKDLKTIKIGDFGLSCVLRNQVATSKVGTPFYMSPEQAQGKEYDFTTDIWSIGCILLELLSLERYDYKSNLRYLDTVLERVAKNYSHEFCDFVRDCLVSDARQRATAARLVTHLKNFDSYSRVTQQQQPPTPKVSGNNTFPATESQNTSALSSTASPILPAAASSFADSTNSEDAEAFCTPIASSRDEVSKWTPDEVAQWLSEISFGDYAAAFRENEINGEALIALEKDDLKQLGVDKIGHQVIIMRHLRDFKYNTL